MNKRVLADFIKYLIEILQFDIIKLLIPGFFKNYI